MWGVCRRALPHRPDAEDAYQATWLVLAGNPGAVRSPAALPAFLHTVAVRTSRRVRQQRPLTAAADHLTAREEVADRVALAALDEELAKLPDRLRRPVLLCHLDGATQAEAARTLGLSLSTLKRRLEDGKDLLRTRLTGRGVDAAVLATAGVMGVGAPAVTASGATVAATILSTEVVSAMWVLKAKGWAAGLVVAAGVTATGGGLMLANGQGPGGGGSPPVAAKPAVLEDRGLGGMPDGPPPGVGGRPIAPAPAADPTAQRQALQGVVNELERAIGEAEKAAAAQQQIVDALKVAGVQQNERMAAEALVARYRESVANHRVELAKTRVEIAKLGPGTETLSVAPLSPATVRLLNERIDLGRKYIRLDREIREIGAIPKEEASSFVVNLTSNARELCEAVAAADPTPAGRLAAAREWYVNTRDAELYYQARSARGLNREQVGIGAALARNRAQTALGQALAAVAPADRDRLAPFTPAPARYAGKVVVLYDGGGVVKPAAGLKSQTAVRVVRGGRPVGVLVVTHLETPDRDTPAERRDTASGIMLPNPDGTLPKLQAGDVVGP